MENAACCPPPRSQHGYEKFYVNCVYFSLEITLVPDGDGGGGGNKSHTAFYNWPAKNIIINILYSYSIFHTCILHSNYGGSISVFQL